ncbi:MAG: hypothetical protein R3B84_21980 [Zavarzinella sp.]
MGAIDPKIASQAKRHLGKAEARWKPLFRAVGSCTLEADPDCYSVLVKSIISQQISGGAARTIIGRVQTLCGKTGFKPTNLTKLTDQQLRDSGVSANKTVSIRQLTERFQSRRNYTRFLNQLTDEEVIQELLPVRGIGRWTAQMFLIFSLGRLDVWPTNDLGVRDGVKQLLEQEELPTLPHMEELSQPWQPYRTIAAWYLWRLRDLPKPQSE